MCPLTSDTPEVSLHTEESGERKNPIDAQKQILIGTQI